MLVAYVVRSTLENHRSEKNPAVGNGRKNWFVREGLGPSLQQSRDLLVKSKIGLAEIRAQSR